MHKTNGKECTSRGHTVTTLRRILGHCIASLFEKSCVANVAKHFLRIAKSMFVSGKENNSQPCKRILLQGCEQFCLQLINTLFAMRRKYFAKWFSMHAPQCKEKFCAGVFDCVHRKHVSSFFACTIELSAFVPRGLTGFSPFPRFGSDSSPLPGIGRTGAPGARPRRRGADPRR